MIRVSITRDWSCDGVTDVDNWELETDATYSPDIADDLARRVSAMRTADRVEMRAFAKEDES